jgi:hypothetical protein
MVLLTTIIMSKDSNSAHSEYQLCTLCIPKLQLCEHNASSLLHRCCKSCGVNGKFAKAFFHIDLLICAAGFGVTESRSGQCGSEMCGDLPQVSHARRPIEW